MHDGRLDRTLLAQIAGARDPVPGRRRRLYVNFIADTGDEARVRASYGAAKYERLARIKAEHDPDNVFHKNANIKPAVSV